MKLPQSVYNWTSILGSLLAAISLALIIFTFIISAYFNLGSSYIGLFLYIIFPMVLILGLILIPIGIFIKRKKTKKTGVTEELDWPRIDLNDSKYRNAFLIFIVTTFFFILLSAIGTYEAYHYSESVEFCGTLCHKVMEPEYVAYQNSPHARVACVECHVGPGADWFVKSKLSGLYQVYAVTTGIYPRPIPTPVKSLRPARETCEKCHWPEKFYAYKNRLEKHYLADEKNTEWDIDLIMKIGSAHSAMGLVEGIHWHINPEVEIEYISNDPKHEEISWVRSTNRKTGEINIFESQENPLPKEEVDIREHRLMDCIDCHTRPSHRYSSPPTFIDNAITGGFIPLELPEIKRACIDATKAIFNTRDTAFMEIEKNMMDFYKTKYPQVIEERSVLLEKAISGLKKVYSQNIFPEMKVMYDVYPDHIGHKETNGCFRCHDNNHISENGKIITKDCNLCHEIKAQGIPGSMQTTSILDAIEFVHPVDIGDAWKEYMCSECHTYLY